MIRQIIFDLDGTLVDSCAICVQILSEMLVDRGSTHQIDPVAARPLMSIGGSQMVATLLGSARAQPDADLKEFRDRYERMVTPPETLFSGVREGLTKLRDAGFNLSICSNKPQNLCEKVLADTDLNSFFDVVVGLRSGLPRKPAPDMLQATIRGLNCAPEECLYVGDSEIDHQVALQAGLPFVFMAYGYADPQFTYDHEFSFDCFLTMSRSIVSRLAAAEAA